MWPCLVSSTWESIWSMFLSAIYVQKTTTKKGRLLEEGLQSPCSSFCLPCCHRRWDSWGNAGFRHGRSSSSHQTPRLHRTHHPTIEPSLVQLHLPPTKDSRGERLWRIYIINLICLFKQALYRSVDARGLRLVCMWSYAYATPDSPQCYICTERVCFKTDADYAHVITAYERTMQYTTYLM